MAEFTLMIMVDALRHDAIDPSNTPFLYDLSKMSLQGEIVPNVSYWILPSIFAGLYPEDAELGYLLWHEPESSPYSFTRYIPFMGLVRRNDIIGRAFRRAVREAATLIERRRGNDFSKEMAIYFNIDGIPSDLLHYFAFADKIPIWEEGSLPSKTVFDMLRERDDQFLYAGFPGLRDFRTQSMVRFFQETVSANHALQYLYFGDLDGVSHTYGPDAPESRLTLQEIDRGLEAVVETARRIFGEIGLLVFGDHGMVKIRDHVDVESALNRSRLIPGRDYLYFLDSTHARFWFLHPEAREEITSVVNQIPGGHLLSPEESRSLHIAYRDPRNHELCYIVEDGGLIYPNFFQRRAPVLGMHGYLPHVRDNHSCFLVQGLGRKGRLENSIEMVDVFAALIALLGFEPPQGCRGKKFW